MVMNFAGQHGVRRADMMDLCHLDGDRAYRLLRQQLVDEGLLDAHGDRRARFYTAPSEARSYWDGGRERTVHFIDWDAPENNTFTAVQQLKVDCPGGQSTGSIRPDIVLFVNGIPLVVVECKAPAIIDPAVQPVSIGEHVSELAGVQLVRRALSTRRSYRTVRQRFDQLQREAYRDVPRT